MLFDPPFRPMLILAVILGAAALTVALYWRGERVASRPLAAALTLLRVGALGGVGFLLLNPVVVRSARGATGKSRLFLVFDVSRSMAVRDVGAQSRLAAAQQAVLGDADLLRALESRWRVTCFTFGAHTRRRSAAEVRALKKPTEGHTRLGRAVTTLVQEATRPGAATAGMLVVSDGRDNGDSPPLSAARLARSAGVPVWTLCLGAASAAKDQAVYTYAAQSFAFVGQRTTVTAEVRRQGYGPGVCAVALKRRGRPVSTQTVTFSGDGRQTVRFPVLERQPGLVKYTFRVAPRPDEITPLNNTRSLFLRVINSKVKVLLLEARPSWEAKFLGHALRKDPNLLVTSIYHFTGSRDYAVTTDNKSRRRVKLPRRYEDLAPYDILMLGKGFEDLLTEKGVALLKRYLAERGGSVVFFRGRAAPGSSRLHELEPVVWSNEEVRNLQLELTEEGRRSLAPSFPTTEPPNTVIRRLPRLLSATRVKKTKSFAVVLARGEGSGDAVEPMAVVAYQRYGAGRVMMIAGQGLWQWAFLPDDLAQYHGVYAAFWSQLVRWLVSGSDFLPGQEFSLRTDRLSYNPNQTVNLLVYAKRTPAPGRRFRLDVVGPDGNHQTVTPAPSTAFGATLVGTYVARQVGDYSATLRTGPGSGDKVTAVFVVTPGQEEDQVTAADPELMRQLAAQSGGRALRRAELRRLPDELRQAEQRTLLHERKQTRWDRPWVLLTLCALLAVEWYLRRRGGLC